MVLVVCGDRLLLYRPAHHLHQLSQFGYLLLADAFVHGIPFDEILLQDVVSPTSEFYTSLALYSLTDRDSHIKIIMFYRTIHESFSFFLNCRKICDS